MINMYNVNICSMLFAVAYLISEHTLLPIYSCNSRCLSLLCQILRAFYIKTRSKNNFGVSFSDLSHTKSIYITAISHTILLSVSNIDFRQTPFDYLCNSNIDNYILYYFIKI